MALVTVRQARAIAAVLKLQVDTLRFIETVDGLRGEKAAGVATRPNASDLALLQYTSGSTGRPKGVMLTHANLLANMRAMGRSVGIDSNDIAVSWLPLYHDMGLIGTWLAALYFAVPSVIMSPLTFLGPAPSSGCGPSTDIGRQFRRHPTSPLSFPCGRSKTRRYAVLISVRCD